MDTESASIAIAAEKLEDLLNTDLYKDHQRNKLLWFPRTDTEEHKQYDKQISGML